MTREAEIRLIKQLPKVQKAILISKVSAVVLFAIGLEGLYTANWWMAGVFLTLGVLFTVWPIRMNMPNVCPRCGHVVEREQTVCDKCGVALM
jgi:rRNA maturation endonuclease Nob1